MGGARRTKREEDAAHSLMGIFDLHMPLIYGEGQKKAFVRMQKGSTHLLTKGVRLCLRARRYKTKTKLRIRTMDLYSMGPYRVVMLYQERMSQGVQSILTLVQNVMSVDRSEQQH